MKYKIIIEEVVADTFEVEANSADEAIEIAEEKYHKCEIVLEPGEVQAKRMYACDENRNMTEWREF